MRDAGQISPSTASEYMRNCIMFYRWVRHRELLAPHVQLWRDKPYVPNTSTRWGSSDRSAEPPPTSVSRTVSDQAKRLKMGCCRSRTDRDSILDFAAENATPELYLMLALGFLPGCGSAASVISKFKLLSTLSLTRPLMDCYV